MMEKGNKSTEKKLNQREYRSVQLSQTDEEYIVEGYATTFEQEYLLASYSDLDVFECVSRNAFQDCDMTDVIMQYDHSGRVFARTRNNTLTLTVDGVGLKVRADLSGTEEGRKLYEDIKGGYIDRMSFGFVVSSSERTEFDSEDKRKVVRKITGFSKLYDVSAVSMPANDYTSISARKFSDGVIAELEAERLKRAKLKLKIKLMED